MTATPENSPPSDRLMVVLGTDVAAPAIEQMPTEQSLLQSLYDRIKCRTVDVVGLRLNGADITAWVDDEGAVTPQARMNVQAMRLAATAGRPGLVLFGTAVITGGADHDGNTLGLPMQMAAEVASHAANTGRGVDRLIIRALLMNETPAHIVERIAAALYRSRARAVTSDRTPSLDQTRQAERGVGDDQAPATGRRHHHSRMAPSPPRPDPTRRNGTGPRTGPDRT